MTTTPPATVRAADSLTGSGKLNSAAVRTFMRKVYRLGPELPSADRAPGVTRRRA